MCIWLPLFAEVEGLLKTQFGMAAQATIPLLVISWLILFFWRYSMLPLVMRGDTCGLGLAHHSMHLSNLSNWSSVGMQTQTTQSEFFLEIFRKKKLG